MDKLAKSTLLLLGMFASSSALAAVNNTGFYLGADVGTTKLHLEDFDTDYIDNAEYNLGLYSGYNFNDWFGVEGHFFGTGDYSNIDALKVNASAISLAPKVSMQFNDMFSGYVKAGVSYMMVRFDTEGEPDEDLDDFGYVVGAGLNAALTDHLNIRLGYEYNLADLKFDDDYADNDKFETYFSQFSLGMHYQF